MGETVWDGRNHTLYETPDLSNYQPGALQPGENVHVQLICALHKRFSSMRNQRQ